ncbi:MAG TPA: hypothetical protein VD995_02840 [Azospirillum sp.]|nr:hypothetical protein [Azospirillum sp.]
MTATAYAAYRQAVLKRALTAIADAQAAGGTVTARGIGHLLGMSESSGLEIRARLVALGWLEVLSRAAGGRASVIRITSDGWTAIDRQPPEEGQRPAAMKERRCLRCRHPFLSEGPHNHICPSCQRGEDFQMGAVEYGRVA